MKRPRSDIFVGAGAFCGIMKTNVGYKVGYQKEKRANSLRINALFTGGPFETPVEPHRYSFPHFHLSLYSLLFLPLHLTLNSRKQHPRGTVRLLGDAAMYDFVDVNVFAMPRKRYT